LDTLKLTILPRSNIWNSVFRIITILQCFVGCPISFLYDANDTWPFLYNDRKWPDHHALRHYPAFTHLSHWKHLRILLTLLLPNRPITICRWTCQHIFSPVVAYSHQHLSLFLWLLHPI
jgi:hypothetical protein